MKKRECENLSLDQDKVAEIKETLRVKRKRVLTVKLSALIPIILILALIIIPRVIRTDVNSVQLSKVNRIISEYEKVNNGDEKLEGTDDVQFSAFFLHDNENDEEQERLKGTCKKIGEEDFLYMELKLLSDGILKDAKIEIDNKNFYMQTALSKDEIIENDYFSDNTTQIELNDLDSKTQKIILGKIRSGNYESENEIASALNQNINNYSRNDNKIIFTAKYVKDGKEIDVRKEINLAVDWYVDVALEENANTYCKVDKKINKENNKVEYVIDIDKTNISSTALIKNNRITGKIPQVDSKNPTSVKIDNENVEFNYNSQTRTFEIIEESVVNDDGEIVNKVPETSKYKLEVEYENSTLENEDNQETLKVETESEAYNNPKNVFDNPIKVAANINVEETVGSGEDQDEEINYVIWYTLNDNMPTSANVVQMYRESYPGFSDFATVYDGDINVTDWYSGYVFESLNIDGGYIHDGLEFYAFGQDIDFIPEAISSGTIVIVNYETPRTANYTIEYYKNGVLQSADTETISTQIPYSKSSISLNISDFNANKYTGYKLDTSSVPESVSIGGTVKLEYVVDETQTKDLWYQLWYSKNGSLPESGQSVTVMKTVLKADSDYLTVEEGDINVTDRLSGYIFSGLNIDGRYMKDGQIYSNSSVYIDFVPDAIEHGALIIVLYESPKTVSYNIEYYKDGVLQSADTETVTTQIANSKTTIKIDESGFNKTKYKGYKLDTTSIPTTVEAGGTIKLQYVYDETQTKDLTYTLWYMLNGNMPGTNDVVHHKITKHVTESDYIPVNEGDINITDWFNGYMFANMDVDGAYISDGVEHVVFGEDITFVPDEIKAGTIIMVNYETAKVINYSVEYYKDGVLQSADTQRYSKYVPNSHDGYLTVDKSQINLKDKYYGYKTTSTVPDTIYTGNTIKVYYEIDPAQTKEVSCTLEFYKEGDLAEELVITNTIHVLEDDIVVIDKENIEINNRYEGYEFVIIDGLQDDIVTYTGFSPALLDELPSEVYDGTILGVYYEKRTDLSYTVNYLEQGTNKVLYTSKVVDKQTYLDTVTETARSIYGYNAVNEEETIEIGVNDNTINFYYTVRNDFYYVINYRDIANDSVLKSSKVVNNVTYGKTYIEEYIDIEGYVPEDDQIEIVVTNNGTQYNLYYTIRTDLSYRVEYYYDGVIDSSLTETFNNQTYGTRIETYTDKVKTGYKFNRATTPVKIGVSENVIKVYYIKDESQTKELSYTLNFYKDTYDEPCETLVFTQTVHVLDEDIITVDKTVELENRYIGYYFDHIDGSKMDIATYTGNGPVVLYELPTEVYDGAILDILYIKRTDLSYVVNYLEQGTNKVLADSKFVDNQTYLDVITESAIDIYGYNSVNSQETITINLENNSIDFYYTPRTDAKYIVYYVDEAFDGHWDVAPEKVVNDAIYGKEYTEYAVEVDGYVCKDTVKTITPTNVSNHSYVFFYYNKRTDLSYSVEYYYNGVKDDSLTETYDNQTFDTEISTYTDKIKTGYKLEKQPGAIRIGTGNNVLKVYYVTDEAQTKTLKYTVQYYKDGIHVETDDQVGEKVVQVLEEDYLEVNVDEINIVNKYYGYKFDKILTEGIDSNAPMNGSGIVEVANHNGVIKVYYVTDESQTKTLSYTIEFYKDYELVPEDTLTFTKTVQVLDEDIIEVDKANIEIENKYDGYYFTEIMVAMADVSTYALWLPIEELPSEVYDGAVLEVYYDKRTDLSYVVNYLEQGTNKTLADSKFVDNQTYLDRVTENAIDIEGYDKVNTQEELEITTGENTITFYYKLRTDLNYKVEYYFDGVLDSSLTEIHNNQTYGTQVNTYTDKTREGYKLEKQPEKITIGVNENVLKVYYIKDDSQTKTLSYTIEFFKDYNLVSEDTLTITKTVHVLEDDILEVDKENIEIENRYKGYYFSHIDTTIYDIATYVGGAGPITLYELPTEVYDGAILNVMYFKRNDLSYVVNYLEEGTNKVLADSKTVEGNTYEAEVTENAIDIFGYNKVNSQETIIIDTENNVINFYYTKRNDFEYKINYVEYGTDTVLAEQKIISNLTFGESFVEMPIAIEGYNADVNKITLTADQESKNYSFTYRKRTDLSYSVEYYFNGVIDATLTDVFNNQTYGTKITIYADKVKEGYKLERADLITIGVGENIVKVYYVTDEAQTKELSYTINFLKEGEIVEEDTLTVTETVQLLEDDIITVNKDNVEIVNKYDGYYFDVIQVPRNGIPKDPEDIGGTHPLWYTFNELPDEVYTGTEIDVFYYKRTDLSYVVNYLEEGTGKTLADSKFVDNQTYLDKITENAIDIFGYNKVNMQETIDITTGENIINFYYTARNDFKYTINHVDKDTGEIIAEPKVVIDAVYGESYRESVIDIDGYYLASDPEIVFTVLEDDKTYELYYVKRTDLSYKTEYYYDGYHDENRDTIINNQVFKTVIDSYIDRPEDGYKFERVEGLPLTIGTGENIIKVYYAIDDKQTKELSYRVEYYKGGVKVEEEVEKTTVQLLAPDTMTVNKEKINTQDKYEGYYFDSTEPNVIPDTVTNGDVIKVNYTVRTDLSYVVNYLEEGTNNTLAESKTVDGNTYHAEITENAIDIFGYNKVNEQETIRIEIENNVINFYYNKKNDFEYRINYVEYGTDKVLAESKVISGLTFGESFTEQSIAIEGYKADVFKIVLTADQESKNYTFTYRKRNDLSYSVEYYYNGFLDAKLTDEFNNQTYETKITTYVDKVKDGYKLERADLITIGVGENVVRVYYITDEAQTKELSYTVEYYKDGVKVEEDVEKTTVQLLAPDTMTVNKEKINTQDKYEGYYFDSTEPRAIPDTAINGSVIRVYYTIRTDLSYKVEYYFNDEIDNTLTEEYTDQTYNSETSYYIDKVKPGYKFDHATTPITIGVGENVIRVYYVTDETQTKELSYTVEYYKDGVKVNEEIEKTTVQLLAPDTMTVNKEKINTQDKYEGYYFDSTEPNEIPDTITSGDIIKVNYIIRKDLSYTVKYYYNGTQDESLTEVFENNTYAEVITSYPDKVKTGYKLDYDTAPITIGVNENIIEVYYATDDKQTKELSYTVEYYKDGTLIETDKETTRVQYLEPEIMAVNKEKINTQDKYEGYYFDSIEPNIIPDMINSGDVIKVNYTIRRDLSYKVEYYFNNVMDETLTEVFENNTYAEEITTYPDKVKPGYRLDTSTAPITIGVNENIIKVYYITDEAQTKELSYTVEYYKDGVLDTTDEVKVNVQLLEPNALVVDKEKINVVNKYDGYSFVSTDPEIIPDIINSGEVIKVHYEIRNDLSYIVNYLEEGTNVSIADTKFVDNQKFNDVVVEYAIDIKGYNKLEEEKSITISTNENEINFYYTKVNDLKYTVKYLEEGTNEVLAEEKTVENRTYLEEITENAIDIEGYTKVNPSETIIIDVDNNEIIFYYEKVQGLTYTVKYLEKDTNESLIEDKVVEGNAYKDEIQETSVDIDGYISEEPTSQTIVIGMNENIITFYYTKRADLEYTIKYIDIDTNEEIKERIVKDNQVFNDTVTEVAPNITGYNSVNKEETITITTGENEVIFYYEKLQGLVYTVKYLEKDTGVSLANEKVVDKNKFEDIVTEEAIDIEGYNAKEPKSQSIVIGVEENSITFYYTKRTDLEYRVEYYYDEILDESKTEYINNQTYQTVIDAYEDKLTEGYKFDKVENIPLTIGVKDNVIKVYYVSDEFEYKVEYYYNNILDESNTVTGKAKYKEVIDTYEDKVKYEYDFVRVENLPLEITAKPESNVIRVYYELKDSTITVKYVDKDSEEEILEAKVIEGKVFDSYNLENEIKEVDGYTLVEKPEKLAVNFTVEPQEFTFYYKKNTKVIVRYLEEDETSENDEDNTVLEEIVIDGYVGKGYTTVAKDFENYNFVDATGPTSGTMTEDTIIVNYYYAKIKFGITEKHIDVKSNELIETNVYELPIGEEYKVEPKEFEGYDLVETMMPDNAEGVVGNEPIEVKYYYIRKASVRVEYIDSYSNEKIVNDAIVEGHEGDNYKVESDPIEHYKLDETKLPQNAEGTMDITINEDGSVNTETVVKYYYIIEAKVVEKHIDIMTDKVMMENVHTGYEGDEYEITPKQFDGYDVVEIKLPDNRVGKLTKEVIEVKYYYIRKATVTVEHINIETGEKITDIIDDNTVIDPNVVIEGHEGDEYRTEPHNFKKYKVVEDKLPDNAVGMMKVVVDENGNVLTNTVVRYYYVAKVEVVEKHIDIKTGKEIEEEIIHEGNEGDHYEIPSKEYEGYDIVEDRKPENAEGTMSKDVVEVKYYYIRRTKVIVEYIDKETGEIVKETIEIRGHEGDEYESEELEIDGYKLVKEEYPENSKGTMDVKVNEDGSVDTITYVRYYYEKVGQTEEPENPGETGKPNTPEEPEKEPDDTEKPNVPEEPVKKKGKVVVKYLEKGTNKVLAKEKTIEGNVDDDYSTDPIEIDKYTLDKKEPANKKGKIKEGTTEVVYYYFLTKTPAKDDVSIKPVDPNKPENEDPFNGKLPSTGASTISNIILVTILIIVVANIIILIRRKVISKKDN